MRRNATSGFDSADDACWNDCAARVARQARSQLRHTFLLELPLQLVGLADAALELLRKSIATVPFQFQELPEPICVIFHKLVAH
jgi:hypothetical protein